MTPYRTPPDADFGLYSFYSVTEFSVKIINLQSPTVNIKN